jgi:hypothetical protein
MMNGKQQLITQIDDNRLSEVDVLIMFDSFGVKYEV